MDNISDYNLVRNHIIRYLCFATAPGGDGWLDFRAIKGYISGLTESKFTYKELHRLLEELVEMDVLDYDGISNFPSWRLKI